MERLMLYPNGAGLLNEAWVRGGTMHVPSPSRSPRNTTKNPIFVWFSENFAPPTPFQNFDQKVIFEEVDRILVGMHLSFKIIYLSKLINVIWIGCGILLCAFSTCDYTWKWWGFKSCQWHFLDYLDNRLICFRLIYWNQNIQLMFGHTSCHEPWLSIIEYDVLIFLNLKWNINCFYGGQTIFETFD